jgi:hypothetical protein
VALATPIVTGLGKGMNAGVIVKKIAQVVIRLGRKLALGQKFACVIAVVGMLARAAGPGMAQDVPPQLRTNEADITALQQTRKLAIDDPVAVFAYVFGQLPQHVKVYPTENYYYFRFVHDGVRYGGNIRLAVSNRNKGEVNFSYGETPSDWNEDPPSWHAALGAGQGVAVERLARLAYRVSLNAAGGIKGVTFELNDLSQVKPPAGFLHDDEQFLGPIFDESGMRFLLVFNRRLKIFHYLLDESTKSADQFFPAKATDRILIGKRTGFAFYQYQGRKVLIGVNERESRLNTEFDGPFDQLPENFIEGDTLRDAIVAADPRMNAKIDRLGYFNDGFGRYLIHPFLLYWQVSDLAVFHRCVVSKSVQAKRRPLCFVIGNDQAMRSNPLPLALKRR